MPTSPRRAHSIRRLRGLIILALVVGMGVFTATMLALVTNLSDRFGPQVRADLEWRALRGATEVAHAAELGIAMGDQAIALQSFGAHAESQDVMAIVAVDANGTVIAKRGEFADIPLLFSGKANAIRHGEGFLVSWSPSVIEGAEIGKVAVAISTARLTETRATLSSVSRTTLIAGALVLILGVIGSWFFTRAVATRDERLHDHAANLERRVEDRTRELDKRNRGMRIVLDNVAQGFFSIDTNGTMSEERSAIVATWFGQHTGTLSDMLRPHSSDFSAWLEASLEMIRDGFMPVEVCIAQMPSSFTAEGRSYSVAYSQIVTGDALEHLLVIISDVTEQLGRERAERDQRELITVFQRIGSDRQGCDEFVDEATNLVASLHHSAERAIHDRALHTLKGNAGMFGFERFAELCHDLEGELREAGDAGLTDVQRARITESWDHVVKAIQSVLGTSSRNVVQIDREELRTTIAHARARMPDDELATTLATWADEPVAHRFERFARQAVVLARRLGKGDIRIGIEDSGIRLNAERWAPLWATLVHAVRNAVDHGLESAEDRLRAGKGKGRISFTSTRDDQELLLVVADDGNGVDWDVLRARAERLGLPATTHDDLVDAMFADGVTTRDVATDTSGRGVGLSALRASVVALGGTIEVSSTRGVGTRFKLRFPVSQPAPVAHAHDRVS